MKPRGPLLARVSQKIPTCRSQTKRYPLLAHALGLSCSRPPPSGYPTVHLLPSSFGDGASQGVPPMKRMLFMLPLVLCAQIASAQVPATFSNRAPDSQQIGPRPPTTTIAPKEQTHPRVRGQDVAAA